MDNGIELKFCVVMSCSRTNYSKSAVVSMCNALNAINLNCKVDVIIGCPFPYMCLAREHLPGNLHVAALNCHKSLKSVHIGEVTPAMLKDIGVTWVILGQAERRHTFRETDEEIGEKAAAVLQQGLAVIICIGETIDDHSAGNMDTVLANQLHHLAKYIKCWRSVVLVYEPIWTLGTGKVARPSDAQMALAFIRKWLLDNVPSASSPDRVRLLYGGVITLDNYGNLVSLKDLNGFFLAKSLPEKDFITMLNNLSVDKEVWSS